MTEPRAAPEPSRRWPQRVAVLGILAVAVCAFVVVVVTSLHLAPSATPAVRSAQLRVRLVGQLRTPVQSAAGVPLATGLGMLVVGGLDQTGAAIAAIQQFASSKTSTLGTMPGPVRGAAAVRLPGGAYLIGGVGSNAGSAITTLPSATGNPTKQVAGLPRPVSDSAVAGLDGAAFLFGGFTGQQPTATVFAWQPGGAPHPTAHLPFRLLYDTAVTVGTHVIVVGGVVNGAPSRAILSFDPLRHTVTTIGRLPVPLARAAAGVIGGEVFVVGGRVKGPTSQTRAIYRVDPKTGTASFAGALPVPLSDAAIASTDGKLFVAGGVNRAGQVQRAIYELSLP
jgi:hypothetical protein